MPILSRTAASSTDPAVGAMVCAGGSQVWTGNSGTLMPRPASSRAATTTWVGPGQAGAPAGRERRRSDVPAEVTSARIPISISVEPSTV